MILHVDVPFEQNQARTIGLRAALASDDDVRYNADMSLPAKTSRLPPATPALDQAGLTSGALYEVAVRVRIHKTAEDAATNTRIAEELVEAGTSALEWIRDRYRVYGRTGNI